MIGLVGDGPVDVNGVCSASSVSGDQSATSVFPVPQSMMSWARSASAQNARMASIVARLFSRGSLGLDEAGRMSEMKGRPRHVSALEVVEKQLTDRLPPVEPACSVRRSGAYGRAQGEPTRIGRGGIHDAWASPLNQ
jgi:hypothetical protein